MYEFLLKYFNQKLAVILTAGWYLMLILLILYLMFVPPGELRYLEY